MQLVYRDITNVVDHRINVILPDYINSEEVEIIIIPHTSPKKIKTKVDYNMFFGVSDIGTTLIDNYLDISRI